VKQINCVFSFELELRFLSIIDVSRIAYMFNMNNLVHWLVALVMSLIKGHWDTTAFASRCAYSEKIDTFNNKYLLYAYVVTYSSISLNVFLVSGVGSMYIKY
jgi:hypothetical protein